MGWMKRNYIWETEKVLELDYSNSFIALIIYTLILKMVKMILLCVLYCNILK